tara:strand:+ start:83 stop:1594 length:1512 start_codon:yes stop_codon:yes gene_type:complete
VKNIYITNVGCEYYLDIARKLLGFDFKVKIIGFGENKIYQPKSLNNFIKEVKPKVVIFEDINLIERFDKIFDPDYSAFSKEFYSEISYFEKLFIMSIDRNSFEPISQLERLRLFHKYFAHAYKLLNNEKIDGILMFGTPHGPWEITLFAVAKILKIDIRYTDFGLCPELSTIESDIYIRKSYDKNERNLGILANSNESVEIKEILEKRINSHFVWDFTPINIFKKRLRVIKRIFGLILLRPFSKYNSAEFFFLRSSRRGVFLVLKYIKYLKELTQSLNFYKNESTNDLPNRNSIVVFLHHQPEASTMPMGYIFADQLLMLEIILNAAPKDLNIYIKEHPHMYEYPAQDRHERSKYFYKQLLRDKRVKFLDQNMNTNTIIKNVKYICSICGSVSWETLKLGKPCIIFGWAWFSDCKSCYSVDSPKSFLSALEKINKKTKSNVSNDLKAFIERLKKRLIYGAALRNAFDYLGESYRYQDGLINISEAIKLSFMSKKKSINKNFNS